MHATLHLLRPTDFPAIRRRTLRTLQVNLGYRCNQTCQHCHVNAGPHRTEAMDAETARDIVALLSRGGIQTLDLTGGAPELNPHFRTLVQQARAAGVRVIDRCNLSILFEPGQYDLAEFLAAHRVVITASLPCYTEDNVDAQRGNGIFEKSILGLQRLNQLGYGDPESGLMLDLVYNPLGAQLPPAQTALEADYKKFLGERYGIVFNRLLTITNMPIQRFGSTLISKGTFGDYMALLRASHRDENLERVMCRDTVSVDWNGVLFDCDFNQMLGLPLGAPGARPEAPMHVRDLLAAENALAGAPITVAAHCYGCTAGQGSSCAGALNASASAVAA